jgi:hypothetical protein
MSDPIAALPQVRAGTIKAYGVTTKTRLLSAPDIPTLDEAGLPVHCSHSRMRIAATSIIIGIFVKGYHAIFVFLCHSCSGGRGQ